MDPAVWAAVGAIGGSIVTAIGALAVKLIERPRVPDRAPPSVATARRLSLPPARPRLLVLEDDYATARLVRHLGEGLDCDVDVARSCAEAIAMAAGGRVWRLVIGDIRLPDGDGVTTMLALSEGQRLRMIGYSGVDEDALAESRSRGLDAVIEKTSGSGATGDLEDAMREMLDR